ncbi:Heat shock 70 kDa protein 12A [Bulinus truncatus]|nr:Heat shock 70 kDa protein 12A [Bulinus truncatus]
MCRDSLLDTPVTCVEAAQTSDHFVLDTPVTCVEAAPTSDDFEETHVCPPPPAPEQICVGQVEDGLREQLALIMDRGFSEGWGAVKSQKPEDLAPEINTETGRAELLCHVIQDQERGEAVERPTLVPAHQRTQPVECDSIVSTNNNGQGDTIVIHTDQANTCVVAEGDVCEYGEPEISSDISSAQDLENRYVHVKQDGKLIQLLNPRTFLSKIIKFPRKSSPEVKKSKVSKRFVEESVREPEPERKNIEIFTVLYQPCSAEILYIPKVNIGVNMDQNTEQHNGATLINEKQHRKETQDKKEILATDEVQKETLAVEEVQKETLAVEEVQKETLAVEEVKKETLAVDEVQKKTMALEEVQKETLAVEEVQKETLAVLNSAKNETIKQSPDVRVKCSQNSTFQETLNDNPPQQSIKNRSLSTSSDDSSSGVEEELIRKDVVSSSHSTHPFHSDAITNLGTDRHVDLPLKEKGTVAESADSNSDRCSGETEGRNDKLEMVKVTPLEELTFIVNNQNEVHQLTKPPVDNFISSVASPSESGHTRSQQVSLSSSVRCPPDEQVETTIASNIQKDKETKSGSCVDKQEEEDKTKIEIEMLGQPLHTDSLHHQQLNDSETQETKTVEESSPVIETHHIVITYTGKDKQPKKKSKKTNSPESDQTKKKHFFSWPFRRNKKINEERKSGEGSSSDDDTGETTVELEDVKIENVDFSKEEETTFNEGSSPRTSTPQDISQNTDVRLDHTVDISTESEQTAESGKSSRRSSVSSSSSVNSITGHIDPSVTLHATPNYSGIVVHEVICVTDKQQQYKSNTDSSDKTTNSSDSETIQTSDTVQTSDNTNTGVADKTLLHKNKHKRNKAPNDISISSKKSGEVEKPFKTTKLKYDKNSSAEPSSSGEDSEEIPRDRTQIHNSQDGQEETQQKVASQTAYTTDGVKSETKPLDTGTSTEKVESASPKSQKASKISKFLNELRSPTKKEPEVNFDNILGSDQRFDGQYHREDDVTHGLPDSQSPSLKSVTQVEYEETSNDPQNVISEPRHFVVVAIDVGTTHSGYAFSFVRDPGSVYMMRRWSGEEPGLVNQKTLTSLLLTPEGNFHSFGYNARSNYLNLIPLEAKHWLYFSTFKMELHHNTVAMVIGLSSMIIGLSAMVIGLSSMIIGLSAMVIELSAMVIELSSMIIGLSAMVIELSAMVIGLSAMVFGLSAMVIGLSAMVIGQSAMVIGQSAMVIVLSSMVIGLSAMVIGLSAMVIGLSAMVIGLSAMVIGLSAMVIGLSAMVIGLSAMELSLDTKLVAANGEKFPAIKVFAYCLEFFKTHALQQLSDQSGTEILNEDIRWVITVPAIWKAPAKQFMREAAYEAGLASRNFPGQLLIALEPEAASIYCRTLRMHQLVPDNPLKRPLQSPGRHNAELNNSNMAVTELTVGSRYLIVDCGGGTVDITVHELYPSGHIKELHRATGGPFGSIGVDSEFEKLLCSIFSAEFIDHYKKKYPMGWVHLMTDFESRKRSTSPVKSTFLNVSLPFTFISDYKKQKTDPDIAVKRYGDPEVDWSQQGMLRLSPAAMRQLFLPTLTHIKQAIGDVLNHPNARDIKYMFLVGGFSESPLLQYEVRHEFNNIMKILIPQEVSLAILKGAVLFGLDPSIVNVRRSRLTYGVGILNKFDPSKHPMSKLVTSSGVEWCTDVFDKYVETDQPVLLGTSVVRRYAPANKGQSSIVLNIYSSLDPNVKFITDPGVSRCGTLSLTLPSINDVDTSQHPREIQAQMSFGDTEISVFAKDVFSGKMVKAAVDFLGT